MPDLRLRDEVLGVLGGMGPPATAAFYTEFLRGVRSRGVAKRPAVVLYSMPLDLDTERSFILGTGGLEDYSALIQEGVRRLESAGVTVIAIPSNTVSALFPELRELASIPIVDTVSVVVSSLTELGVESVAVFGTSALIKSHAYQDRIRQLGLQVVVPEEAIQDLVDRAVAGVIAGTGNEEPDFLLYSAVQKLAPVGVDCLLLACTELHMAASRVGSDLVVVDSLPVLAHRVSELVIDGGGVNRE